MKAILPSFHDGTFTGIQLADDQVTLLLRRENGDVYEVTLFGVEALQMEDFRQGNIISLFEIIAGKKPDASLLERLFPGPHRNAAAHFHEAHAQFLAGKVARIEAGEATLISMTPSYGADLVAFCGSVALRALGSSDRNQAPFEAA